MIQYIPFNELQKFIYDRLVAKGLTVYDYVPASEDAYPYLVIGNCDFSDWSSKSGKGIEIRHQFSCYSSTRGMKETNDLMNSLITAFIDSPRTALTTDAEIVDIELEPGHIERDTSTGEVRYGEVALLFRITTTFEM